MEGKALLRDIIDLEAMYGGVPGADGPLAQGIAGVIPGLAVPPADAAGIVNGTPAPAPVVKPRGRAATAAARDARTGTSEPGFRRPAAMVLTQR